jgi:hypothetical protein
MTARPGITSPTSSRRDELTALAGPDFEEQLDVLVENGVLRAEHAFWGLRFPFLTLHYRMERKPAS